MDINENEREILVYINDNPDSAIDHLNEKFSLKDNWTILKLKQLKLIHIYRTARNEYYSVTYFGKELLNSQRN